MEHRHGSGEQEREMIEVPDRFRGQMWAIVEKYLSLQETLAADDKDAAVEAAALVTEALSTVDMSLLNGKPHDLWMGRSGRMNDALDSIKQGAGIEAVRTEFEKLSNEFIASVEQFGVSKTRVLYRLHCPMAFDNQGADWLQADKETRNPYFGASMPKCGEIVHVVSGKTE
jgi:Cu(I)/Ag(I) efflux system membrane fusion protein